MNKDGHGLKQIKYIKMGAYTMIFKKKEKKKKSPTHPLVLMCGKGNPFALLVGMRFGAVTM